VPAQMYLEIWSKSTKAPQNDSKPGTPKRGTRSRSATSHLRRAVGAGPGGPPRLGVGVVTPGGDGSKESGAWCAVLGAPKAHAWEAVATPPARRRRPPARLLQLAANRGIGAVRPADRPCGPRDAPIRAGGSPVSKGVGMPSGEGEADVGVGRALPDLAGRFLLLAGYENLAAPLFALSR
jgi:hypothetical protein